jgi:hypothetical protein
LSYLTLLAARKQSNQGNRDTVPNSASDDNNAQSGQSFYSFAPPPYRAADTAQNSTTQRSWAPTPEASNSQFAQGHSHEISYNQQRFLNSADIQATRRTPSTLHNTFCHSPLEGSSSITSNYLYNPSSSCAASSPWENQYDIVESQAMPQLMQLDSLGSRNPYQHRGTSFFSQYSNATGQQDAFTLSLLGNEVERSSTPALRARPPIPPKLSPNDSRLR